MNDEATAALGEAVHSLLTAKADDEAAARQIQPCRFGASGPINKEQLRAITMLNDLFARNLTHNLGAWLRTGLEVVLTSVERVPYGEILQKVPDVKTYLASLRVEPLDVISLLQMDLTLVPPMVDLLLGGTGQASKRQAPTEIEEAILKGVMDVILRELSGSWETVGLHAVFDKRQLYGQLGRLLPAAEKTLCITFEVRMAAAHGALQLVFPAVIANTLLRRLGGDWERKRRRPSEIRQKMEQHLSEVKYGTTLQLPPVRVSARELTNLVPGSVLRFNLPADVPAQLLVGGLALFEARPVRHGAHRAAHLVARTQTQHPRKRLETDGGEADA